jgi:glycine cleavage system H protein
MADGTYPEGLLYHPEHDWAKIHGDTATFGITDFAQEALGEVVFFDPPIVCSSVIAGDFYAEIESVKAVTDVVAPLSGVIIELNSELVTHPELINDDPYGRGWMVKVRLSDPSQTSSLMDAAAYCANLS